MCSRFRNLVVLFAGLFVGVAACAATPRRELRVCADPNNLPFSNQAREGFENRLAELIAQELNAQVRYTWWAQRRGFVRNTLNQHTCDLIMGVPTSFELALTTRPYYRSSYVFVWRKDRELDIRSLDDPLLKRLRVGVQVIGDDYASTPPAQALSNRGAVDNIVGYSVYGDYAKPNPPARIIDAVVAGDIDVAIAWGPLAGYFGRRAKVPLVIRAVTPQVDVPFLPMVFDISLGVRRADTAFQRTLNELLVARRADIDALLDRYGIPRVDRRPGGAD
jgi:mxaJ protein